MWCPLRLRTPYPRCLVFYRMTAMRKSVIQKAPVVRTSDQRFQGGTAGSIASNSSINAASYAPA